MACEAGGRDHPISDGTARALWPGTRVSVLIVIYTMRTYSEEHAFTLAVHCRSVQQFYDAFHLLVIPELLVKRQVLQVRSNALRRAEFLTMHMLA